MDIENAINQNDRLQAFAANVIWVDNHLDEQVSEPYKVMPLAQDWARVAKVIEEAGEAIAELIGMTGQNPRKGITSDQDKLLGELADTALTAIYAMQHFTKDVRTTWYILTDKSAYHRKRMS